MRFNISSTSLCTRLQNISRVQSSKSSLPILDCILFEVQDGYLKLTASDSETTMVTRMDIVDVDGEGMFAVGSKQLIESIKEIPDQPITFVVDLDTFAIEVLYQNGRYNIVGQNGHDYPVPNYLNEASSNFSIDSETLLNSINRLLFATAEEDFRPQMTGVFFDMAPEYITLVASDGHKLVRDRILSVHSSEPASFILPKKPALLLKTVLPKVEGEVVVSFDGRNAEMRMDEYVVSCRLIEGRYPNYNSVIPQDNPFRVIVDRQAFISALRRVVVFSSQSSKLIKLHVENNTLTVSAQDVEFSTSAEEHIICDYDGSPMSIGFSGVFLIDVLGSIPSQSIVLELADPSRAGVIQPAEQGENEELLMLIMPMMLNE